MTPEGKVKIAVKAWMQQRRAYYYMPVQNGMGVVGVPDFVCCIPVTITPDMVGQSIGLFAGVETKAPGKEGSATANQLRHIKLINEAHGAAGVVSNTEHLEDVLYKFKLAYVPS
jgi:hypothetical protein